MKSLIELLNSPQLQTPLPPVQTELMAKESMQKQAALAIRTLQTKVAELEEKLAVYDQATELALRLAQYSDLSTMETFKKLGEFSAKSKAELQVIEKAFEYTKTGSVGLGSLSDESDPANLDPLTSYLLTAIGEN